MNATRVYTVNDGLMQLVAAKTYIARKINVPQTTSYHRVQEIQVSESVPLHGIVSSGCSGFALVLKDEPVFYFFQKNGGT